MNDGSHPFLSRKVVWALALLVALAAGVLYVVWPYWRVDREAEMARLMDLLQLGPGVTAADVGAGDGEMTVILARKLGPAGRVFATEIDAEKLTAIEEAVAEAGLTNVTVLQAGKVQTGLPRECCDAVFLRKVYHHITDPAATNASLLAALQPGGRLAIIDFEPRAWLSRFSEPKGVPDDRGGHGAPPRLVIEELTDAGFALERRIDDWPGKNYCLIFRKPLQAGSQTGRGPGAAPAHLLRSERCGKVYCQRPLKRWLSPLTQPEPNPRRRRPV